MTAPPRPSRYIRLEEGQLSWLISESAKEPGRSVSCSWLSDGASALDTHDPSNVWAVELLQAQWAEAAFMRGASQ